MRPHIYYSARAAQHASDSLLVSARRGIDENEDSVAAKLRAIQSCMRRGISPEQMSTKNGGPVDLSPSTIYRWVAEGFAGMTNMELRRKVGYKPRKHVAPRATTSHSPMRSHSEFLALGDVCEAAWEMDTVEGTRTDTVCLLTLLHRPSRLQLVLPLAEKSSECVVEALRSLQEVLGKEGVRRMFRCVLTDNGAEFSDEEALGHVLCEQPGETRLFYCDPRRSDQKGVCAQPCRD